MYSKQDRNKHLVPWTEGEHARVAVLQVAASISESSGHRKQVNKNKLTDQNNVSLPILLMCVYKSTL